jgi:hypothetical protein
MNYPTLVGVLNGVARLGNQPEHGPLVAIDLADVLVDGWPVAMVNNIPVRARSWCHGSIANRMQYLHDLSTDPTRTKRFDRFMFFLYGGMLFALFAGAAFCWASNALH